MTGLFTPAPCFPVKTVKNPMYHGCQDNAHDCDEYQAGIECVKTGKQFAGICQPVGFDRAHATQQHG